MYCCICYTCDEETLLDGFADAQDLFTGHARRSHEVELFNLEATAPLRGPSATPTGGERGEPAEE